MKKLATLFSDSFQEFRHVNTLTTAAMFGAIAVVLGVFPLVESPALKVGLSTLPRQSVYYLFGPSFGMFFGAAMDLLTYFVKPTGAFNPFFTLNAMLGGLLYGLFYYKHKASLIRSFAANLCVCVICNIIINTYLLTTFYGDFMVIDIPLRISKNLIQWPINSILFFAVAKAMKKAKIFRL